MSPLKEPLRKDCQDELIQVNEVDDRAIHPIANAKVYTQANARASQVETLAKLYLEGEAAEISDATIAELCDWLWIEFQNTPLNVQFSWYSRYNNATEMFADIQQNHLWVSDENYDTTLGINPIYNFIFQAMHDNDHYRTHSDFSLQGEIATYKATAKRAPSLNIQKIIYSESVLRSAAYLFLGHAPLAKIVFP
ncbi:transposase [Microcoleus sp. OTE_8_concoct_300]|uniref:transposase n=1 Tax=Microcoleus sp. OTE_8_concoct_300 TaxID=2964710 RepID=UPI00403F11FA